LAAFISVNILLVAIWATVAEQGFFWPVFPFLGWGIGIVAHWWAVFQMEPSEAQIEKEMRRLR
jgi:hypothetical protein